MRRFLACSSMAHEAEGADGEKVGFIGKDSFMIIPLAFGGIIGLVGIFF